VNLTEFKDTIAKTGLARSNRWVFEITPPQGLSRLGASLLQTRQGGFANYPVLGDIDIGDVVNGDINISTGFGNLEIRIGDTLRKLELYCKSCQIPSRDVENFEYSYYGEKVSAGSGHTHDGLNCTNTTAIYRFREAYPTNVGSMDLNSEAGEVLETSVTWNYRNYERIL